MTLPHHPMVRRGEAAQATFDQFIGKPLRYGRFDCGKMVIAHLRRMGHRPRIGAKGTWKSLLGLRRFIESHGGSGAACLDGWGLRRIAPAQAVIGDLVELPGEPPFGAFALCVGNGRVLAWSEHEVTAGTCAVLQPLQIVAAWRV